MKKIMLVSGIVLGIILIVVGLIPDLPSSKPISPGNNGAEIRQYIFENLFSIVFFIVSLAFGLLIEIYALSLRRKVRSFRSDGRAAVILGIFILVSGIWVLTDSKALSVFTTDFGGPINKHAIAFVSYISIMLLPVIFISFLQYVIKIGKMLGIIDGLFILNLCAFIVCSIFNLSKEAYFIFLFIHHVLIYILMITGMIYFLKNFRGTRDKQKKCLLHGVLFFTAFSFAALVVFLFGFPHLYAIIYGVGFAIMIQYMIRLTVHKMLLHYNQSVKTELYKSMAYTDTLTDIKNRNAFIEEQYGRLIKENTCCIVMDINRLKWVNDTFGHGCGDKLIRRLAKVIYDSFSDIGVCYRIGGDEFAVVCQNADESSVKNRIEKMNADIASIGFDSETKIGLSYGYAFGGNDLNNFADLFNAADKEMYLDKKQKLLSV